MIAEEDAFAYFDFYGSPRVMHFLTRVGVSPRDGNVHYCLDFACDVDSLRKLDDVELSERMKTEPRPIRRLKVNGSPFLYPLWDIEPARFGDATKEELLRTASLVKADGELQIYGGGFFSDDDRELCTQFHSSPWEERLRIVDRFDDSG